MLYVFTSGQMNTAIRPQELCEAEQLTESLWFSFSLLYNADSQRTPPILCA